MDSSCRYRSGTDAAFPLSDHADHDGLLELVKQVQPKKVFTVHGFTREFAQTLRAQGVDAVAPGWHEQLALLAGAPDRRSALKRVAANSPAVTQL